MTMPNFLIIGAAKSGTSALWRYLPQHPDVYMSPKKEPHFFAYEGEAPDAAGPGDYTKYAKTDLASYQALFAGVTSEVAIGEAAMTSLYMPQAIHRIQQYIPDARLIAILRQPADRAYSAYMHLRRDYRETEADFRQALKLENYRIANHWGFMWHFTSMGFYYPQLRRFYDTFDRNQLRTYLHEDFVDHPNRVIQDIFEFLEVNSSFVPDMSFRPNVSGVHKSQLTKRLYQYLFDRPNPIRGVARRLISDEQRVQFTTKARNYNLSRQTLPAELRNELTSLFHDDILKLQELIDKDLSHWLAPSE